MESIQLKLATKRRIVACLLWALVLWPLTHRYLVSRFDLSPWRFFGWAMYCVPVLSPVTSVYLVTEAGREPLEPAPESTLEEMIVRFEKERLPWGRLHEPDEIGRWLLDSYPELATVEVEVEERRLETRTATIVAARQIYIYGR